MKTRLSRAPPGAGENKNTVMDADDTGVRATTTASSAASQPVTSLHDLNLDLLGVVLGYTHPDDWLGSVATTSKFFHLATRRGRRFEGWNEIISKSFKALRKDSSSDEKGKEDGELDEDDDEDDDDGSEVGAFSAAFVARLCQDFK